MVDEDKEIDDRRLSTEDVVSTDKEGVSTDFEKVSTDRPIVSTDGSKVSTDEQVEGTKDPNEGTDENLEGTKEQNEDTVEIFEGLRQIDFLVEKLQEQKRAIYNRSKELSSYDTIAAQKKEGKAKKKVRRDRDEESTRKRKLGTRKKMKSRKRRYIQYTSEDDSDKENDELRLYLTIAQDEEKEVGTMNLNAVYQLVMDKYQDEMPEGFDRVLWGDLMVLFNPDDKDEFWSSQLDWIIVSWKLHSSSGVHTLVTDTGLVIHMLVEKKYPLRKEVLMQMLKLKLEVEEEDYYGIGVD
ncbi:hypothetical protein Tco_0216670 [Tanacetum coccineum]